MDILYSDIKSGAGLIVVCDPGSVDIMFYCRWFLTILRGNCIVTDTSIKIRLPLMKQHKLSSGSFTDIRNRAQILLGSNETIFPPHLHQEFVRLVHELETNRTALELENAELRKTQKELIRSRDKYTDQYDLICRFDTQGRITFVNDAYCRCYEVKREDILGTNYIPNIYKDDLPLVEKHFNELTQLRPTKTIEHRVIMPDGEIRWQEWCGRTMCDEIGTVVECQVVGRDITERKNVELHLRNEMKIRQHFIDALPCIALLLRYETREIVASNKAAVKIGAVPGTKCFKTWGNSDTPCPWCRAQQLWQNGEPQNQQFWGNDMFWDAYWIPVGEGLYLHYAFDITELKRAKDHLQQDRDILAHHVRQRTRELTMAHEQLLHAEKLGAIGRLSASIAHEFNNPLQGIMYVLSGLKRRVSFEEEDAELVSLALEECVRMKNLIKNLQDFNRPTSGKTVLMDINRPLENIIQLGKKKLKNKGIILETHFSDNLPKLYAVADQIQQVLLNLWTNAVDACHKGDTISITTSSSGETVVIRFKDTGDGIKPDDLPHIFEPFFTTKDKVKGTGLGLSVSYGILKRHNGSIEVKSDPGNGSNFTVSLPVPKS